MFWYHFYQVDSCGEVWEDSEDCGDLNGYTASEYFTHLTACTMTYGFDDCNDIDLSVCEWTDPDTFVTHSEECEVFAEWWEEYLRCLPEIGEDDCNDDNFLNSCTTTYYSEPCTGIEICSIEFEDRSS